VIRDRPFWAALAAVLALAVLAMLVIALVFAVLLRNPRPPVAAATDLLAVRFADQETGWVGGARVIYATADARVVARRLDRG
jgi:hypothetical protein